MGKKESILKQIRDNLRKNGFEAYYPTQHEGECLTEYVVIMFSGTVELEGTSSVADTYQVLCYVPKNKYSRLMDFANEVRTTMRNIFPIVRESGNQTTTFYDENIKGHMISIEYMNYRKILYRN